MRATRLACWIGLAALLASPSVSPARAESAPLPSVGERGAGGWLGADKQPLPLQSEDELLTFLRTAREVSSKTLSQGITKAKKLRLSKDEIEAHVVFHHVDRSEQKVKRLPNGNVVMFLRDSYLSQVGAYELGRLLGIGNIPPTVLRTSGGQRGSAQLWIEEAMTEESRQGEGLEPPDHSLWNQHYADMRVFDNLINNIDRNQGNMLVDSRWRLWLIDHTRAFGRDKSLPQPETVTRCSRRLWTALREWNDVSVRERLAPYLTAGEIKALLERRRRLVRLIEQRIAGRGEHMVLFDYGDPDPGIEIEYQGSPPDASPDEGARDSAPLLAPTR